MPSQSACSAGQAMHGLLQAHHRAALVVAVLHQLEEAQRQVVEGHVADVRAGIGEGYQLSLIHI